MRTTLDIADDVPSISVDTPATGAYGSEITGSVDMAFGADGERLWIQPVAGTESELDAYIERQRGYDPDLWVVEIEDRQGRHFIVETVRD